MDTIRCALISTEIFACDLPSLHAAKTHLKSHHFLTQLPLEVERDETVMWLAWKWHRLRKQRSGWGSRDQPSPSWSCHNHSHRPGNWIPDCWDLFLCWQFVETWWQQMYCMSSGAFWFQPVDPCLFRISPYVNSEGWGQDPLFFWTEGCTKIVHLWN